MRRPVLVGLAAAAVIGAQVSPLAHWADTRSFAAHMVEHLLLGDIAPLLLVVALRRMFFARTLNPALTFPIWLANLYAWHIPVAYEAALHHLSVHATQHVALFAGGVLLWAPVLELTSTPRWFGDAARLGYLLLMMFASVLLGALLLWWPRTLYSTYAHAGGFAGLSPQGDQRAGGGAMLIEGTLVTFAVAGWIVWRIFREDTVTHAEPGAYPSP